MRSVDLDAVALGSARRWLPVDQRGTRVAIALSGGLDSVVLLDLLLTLQRSLPIAVNAFHVNHGLSPNADRWQAFCAELCVTAGIGFLSVKIELDRASPKGIEGAARAARYAAIEGLAAQSSTTIVALAHHADDQAETVLLQLLRGGAPRGLAAMAEWRAGNAGKPVLWRPLLAVTRAQIAAHAAARQLRWIDDESNSDVSLKRNFLRARVMPMLETGFPGYRNGLARAARFAAETALLLGHLGGADATLVADEKGLKMDALRELGTARTLNVVRHLLRSRGFPVPTSDRLAEFVRQALAADIRAHPSLDLDNGQRLCADGGHILIAPADCAFRVVWQAQPVLELAHGRLSFERRIGAGFCAGRVPSSGLSVRPRKGGEKLKLALDRPHRTLKNLMQEAGIALALRDGWPLLVHYDRVVAIPGIGVSVDWRCPPDQQGWTVEWQPFSTVVGENNTASVMRRSP